MWFTDCLLGIGMCTMTDCMLMRFLLTPTDYGGIGALTILTDRVGDSVGDGAHRGITAVGIQITGMAATGAAVIGDIILGTTIIIPATVGAAATGVAGMAADIGDIITIGMVVLAGAGAEVEDLIMPDVV